MTQNRVRVCKKGRPRRRDPFNPNTDGKWWATLMKRVHIVRKRGERIEITFDEKGQPKRKHDDELISWIGVLAREHGDFFFFLEIATFVAITTRNRSRTSATAATRDLSIVIVKIVTVFGKPNFFCHLRLTPPVGVVPRRSEYTVQVRRDKGNEREMGKNEKRKINF